MEESEHERRWRMVASGDDVTCVGIGRRRPAEGVASRGLVVGLRKTRQREKLTIASQRIFDAGKRSSQAGKSEADMVFIDLEDSVLASDKAGAREQAIYALNNMIWGQKTRAVRVKDVRSQYGYTDVVKVAEGAGQSLDLLVILKVRSVADVTVCRYVTRRHRGAL